MISSAVAPPPPRAPRYAEYTVDARGATRALFVDRAHFEVWEAAVDLRAAVGIALEVRSSDDVAYKDCRSYPLRCNHHVPRDRARAARARPRGRVRLVVDVTGLEVDVSCVEVAVYRLEGAVYRLEVAV